MTQLLITVLTIGLASVSGAKDSAKVVLVAGHRSHGWGAHEFNAGCLLMQAHLKEALGKKVEVVVHRSGWPKDPDAFKGADTIVLFMDGGGRHPINGRLEQVKKEIDRGCGLMCMHYAVEVPAGRSGKALQSWIGGYYETGWSINPHWVAKSKLNTKHPVSRGVVDFSLKDEWYFNMRFREGRKGVTSILEAVPDKCCPLRQVVLAAWSEETHCRRLRSQRDTLLVGCQGGWRPGSRLHRRAFPQ